MMMMDNKVVLWEMALSMALMVWMVSSARPPRVSAMNLHHLLNFLAFSGSLYNLNTS